MENNWFVVGLFVLLVINTIGAIITVFRRPRSIASVFAWLLALIFLPGIGFFLYLFAGRKIDDEIIYRLNSHREQRIEEITLNRPEKRNARFITIIR